MPSMEKVNSSLARRIEVRACRIILDTVKILTQSERALTFVIARELIGSWFESQLSPKH